MLSAAQHASLQAMVQRLHPELQIEDATLDAQQTLEVILCRALVCFRPFQVRPQEVDVVAALAGQPAAQQAFQKHLQALLQEVL